MSVRLAVQLEKKRPAPNAQRPPARVFQYYTPLLKYSGSQGLAGHKALSVSHGVPRAECAPKGGGLYRLTFRVRTTDRFFDTRLIKSAMDGASFTMDKRSPPYSPRFFKRSTPLAQVYVTITLKTGHYELCMGDVPVVSLGEWKYTLDRLGRRFILLKELRQLCDRDSDRDRKTKEILRYLPQL